MAKAAYISICGEQGSFQVLGTTPPGLDVSPQAVLKCLCAPHSSQLEQNSHPGLSLWFDPCIPNFPGAVALILALSTASASAENAASAHSRGVSQGLDCVPTFLLARGCPVPRARGAEGQGSLVWAPLNPPWFSHRAKVG